MESTQQLEFVKTRFLVLSDTHGTEFRSEQIPSQYADVAIHCGDLTEESKLEEYECSLRLLKNINAPLKLVIAGNHDYTLDTPTFREHVGDARLDPTLVRQVYGGWGFQYPAGQGHNFEIAKGVDLVITHGPPKGIMDYTDNRERAGCPCLFGAFARARPRLHCFGHIHEGWGGKLITWRDQVSNPPSHFTDIDNDRSVMVEKLSGFRQSKFDTPESKVEKLKKTEHYRRERCYATSHCAGDANPLKFGAETLFINAAIEGTEEYPLQLPWLVELELPLAASWGVK
ncbi:MAG: hypothetical protein Q9167_006482 [Letrouitia subvulpina]